MYGPIGVATSQTRRDSFSEGRTEIKTAAKGADNNQRERRVSLFFLLYVIDHCSNNL